MSPEAGARRAGQHIPYRTCVGCRQRDQRSRLLRLVLDVSGQGTSRVLPDVAGRLPGRGAWIHATQVCVEQAVSRRAFARAWKTSGALDTSQVQDLIDIDAAHHGPPDLGGSRTTKTESGFDADEHPMSTQR